MRANVKANALEKATSCGIASLLISPNALVSKREKILKFFQRILVPWVLNSQSHMLSTIAGRFWPLKRQAALVPQGVVSLQMLQFLNGNDFRMVFDEFLFLGSLLL